MSIAFFPYSFLLYCDINVYATVMYIDVNVLCGKLMAFNTKINVMLLFSMNFVHLHYISIQVCGKYLMECNSWGMRKELLRAFLLFCRRFHSFNTTCIILCTYSFHKSCAHLVQWIMLSTHTQKRPLLVIFLKLFLRNMNLYSPMWRHKTHSKQIKKQRTSIMGGTGWFYRWMF